MTKRVVAFECPECSFKLWHPIFRLSVSTLGLYDDARFPGRCLLVLNEHFEEFSELPDPLAIDYLHDIQWAGRGIMKALRPDRINYAILGNMVPHVHTHIIPRSAEEPLAHKTPWEHPGEKAALVPEALTRIGQAIVSALQEPSVVR